MDCWTQHCPIIGQLDSRTPCCSTIGLLDTAWLLDCLKQHCPTIGPLDKAQSDDFAVEYSAGQPSDSLTQHWLTTRLLDTGSVWPLDRWKKYSLTIGLLDTQLTSHRTVGHSINQPSDCWTQHSPNIEQFDKILSSNCPTIGMFDTALFKHFITSCPKIRQ